MRSILLGTMQSGKPRTLGSNTGVSGDVFLTFLVRGIPCEIWKLINVFFNGPSHMSTIRYLFLSPVTLTFVLFVFHQFFLVLSAFCMCLYSLISIHSLYFSYFVFLSILSYSTTSTGLFGQACKGFYLYS